MRLASYIYDGKRSYGAVLEGGVLDLCSRIGAQYPTLLALLEADAVDVARRLAADARPDILADAIEYLPVIPDRINIFCTGLNYADHIAENNRERPQFPRLFMKLDESLVGANVPLMRPKASTEFEFEGELMVVLGREARYVAQGDALDYVVGYTIFNDGSIRDYQRRTTDQGKNFSRSSSVGPCLVTRDEAPPVETMRLETRLNGRLEQSAAMQDMIFPVARLVEYFSSITRLRPGDMIATGTCGRLGSEEGKAFMRDGDVVEIEITGLGTLRNPILDER